MDGDWFIVFITFFQELEDQLQEEQNKVNHLKKVQAKLEQQMDEVCTFFMQQLD